MDASVVTDSSRDSVCELHERVSDADCRVTAELHDKADVTDSMEANSDTLCNTVVSFDLIFTDTHLLQFVSRCIFLRSV